MNSLNTHRRLMSTVALLATLSACGGGGGGGPTPSGTAGAAGTPAPTPAPAPTSAPAPAPSPRASAAPTSAAFTSLVTAVPISRYRTTFTNDVFTLLNRWRRLGGFGLLAQSLELDRASENHAAYLVRNQLLTDFTYLSSREDNRIDGLLGAHREVQGLPGFTGKTPSDRAVAAGYVGTASELTSIGVASGVDCAASFENSVYHLIDLVAPALDVGIAFDPGDGKGSLCVLTLGVPSASLGQLPPAGNMAVYPHPDQVGVLPNFFNIGEVPNPAPDLAQAGRPVLVSLHNLGMPTLAPEDVRVDSFSLSGDDGSALPSRILVRKGVTSGGPALVQDPLMPSAGYLILLPTRPLATQSQYTARVQASVKGQVVSFSWRFITGDGSPMLP